MTDTPRPTYWHVEGMYLRETAIPGGFQWDLLDKEAYARAVADAAALVAAVPVGHKDKT